MRISPLFLILALFGLGLVFFYVQVGVLVIAFHKLGLSGEQAFILCIAALVGSFVNLPVVRVRGIPPDQVELPPEMRLGLFRPPPYRGVTLIAVNVGGCVVPVLFSLYLLGHSQLQPLSVVLATALVTGISYALSRPMPGIGIGIPILVAPIAAALAGTLFGGEERAVLAYVAGTTGVLFGADLLRLSDVRRIGAAVASIGGAGTFDGIFLAGVVAVLLA